MLERKRRLRNAHKTHFLRSLPRGSNALSRRLWAQLKNTMDAGQTWFVISIVGEHWVLFILPEIIKILLSTL